MIKRKVDKIGTTADIIQEGIIPKEEFQKVFLERDELIQKDPLVTRNIYLSNMAHRTFSYPVYSSLDGKSSCLTKEKLTTGTIAIENINTGPQIYTLNSDILKRCGAIGLEVENASTGRVGIHIRAQSFSEQNVENVDDLYFFVVQGKTISSFQFPFNFSYGKIIAERLEGVVTSIWMKITYIPL